MDTKRIIIPIFGEGACCVGDSPVAEISMNVSVHLHDGGVPVSVDE